MRDIDKSFNHNTNCTIVLNKNEKDLTDKEKQTLLDNYYRNIVDDFTITQILGNDRNMSLNDIYVEPHYKVLLSQTTHKDEGYSSRFVSISNDSIHRFLNHYFVQDSFPDELKLKNSNIVLLLGQPGQGKTSFSKKTIFDYIIKKDNNSPNYFMIRLRDVGQVDRLLDEPIEVIEHKLQRTLSFTPSFEENTILLLDGLDELAMKEQLVTDTIDNFLETLIKVTKDYPKLKILLTSRTLYVNIDKLSKKLKGDILTLHLQEFSLEKQIEWIEKYKKFYPDALMSKEILEQLHDNKNQHILELIEQPILLHMITELNMTHDELTQNTNRAKIYKKMFDSIINRKWESGKEHENLKGLVPDDIRELLQTIAFEIYKSDYEYIHKSKLEKLPAIKEFYVELDIDLDNTKKLDGILKGVLISFYFQEIQKIGDDDVDDSGNYAIEFMHKSLQEYLVAEKIFHEILRIIEKDRKNKYFITDYQDVLKIIWELFSSNILSYEIHAYLIDIIKNYPEIDEKQELSQRLEHFLEHLLEKDFLFNFNLAEDNNPMNKTLNVFYGYWTILSYLDNQQNYIKEKFHNKFFQKLLLLTNKFFSDIHDEGQSQHVNFNLSYQHLDYWFSGSNLMGINFHKANLKDSKFDSCWMYSTDLSYANLENCSFNNSQLNCDFTGSNLNGASFNNSSLKECIFKDTKLNNIGIDDDNAKYLKDKGIAFTIKEKDLELTERFDKDE